MQGELIALADVKAQVRAEPADVNVLPGYGSDPRVVANLFDGALATCDDHHLWLAPFTAGARHTVSVDLRSLHRLSLVRIWNYNKSRIHSFRGARHVEIALDGAPIFRGEINKAPGNAYEAESCAEPILFTDVRRAIRRDSARFGANSSDQSDAPPGRLRTRACSARSSGETPSASPPPSPPRRRRRRPSGRPPPSSRVQAAVQLRPQTADVRRALMGVWRRSGRRPPPTPGRRRRSPPPTAGLRRRTTRLQVHPRT